MLRLCAVRCGSKETEALSQTSRCRQCSGDNKSSNNHVCVISMVDAKEGGQRVLWECKKDLVCGQHDPGVASGTEGTNIKKREHHMCRSGGEKELAA